MNIEKVKFAERFDLPRKIYLRNNDSRYCDAHECMGKTKKSWVVSARWRIDLYQFREYTEITEREYKLYCWSSEHGYKISRHLEGIRNADWLLAVAKLIGYPHLPEEDTTLTGVTRGVSLWPEVER